ncbi:hypothetical protein R1flu_024314 [Riccia fluitans]|uniref:Uncharacterized protein n=1 Tax=Riccia fluitans TaxID=41844 RepID=A0ABD1XUI9_9MARC
MGEERQNQTASNCCWTVAYGGNGAGGRKKRRSSLRGSCGEGVEFWSSRLQCSLNAGRAQRTENRKRPVKKKEMNRWDRESPGGRGGVVGTSLTGRKEESGRRNIVRWKKKHKKKKNHKKIHIFLIVATTASGVINNYTKILMMMEATWDNMQQRPLVTTLRHYSVRFH